MGELDITLENSGNGLLEIHDEENYDLMLDQEDLTDLDLDTNVTGNYYNSLLGLPSIDGVTIKGNLTHSDLFLTRGSSNTKAYWDSNPLYIPQAGEIIIYQDRQTIEGVNYSGIKIGDGSAYLVDLPFVGDDLRDRLMAVLNDHINNQDVHVTLQEKQFWNNKLNCTISNDNLILDRM